MAELADFVATLDRWREDQGLGHNAFARKLGVSHGYWQRLRTRQRQPSRTLVGAWLQAAPEPWRSALEKAHLSDLSHAVRAA